MSFRVRTLGEGAGRGWPRPDSSMAPPAVLLAPSPNTRPLTEGESTAGIEGKGTPSHAGAAPYFEAEFSSPSVSGSVFPTEGGDMHNWIQVTA